MSENNTELIIYQTEDGRTKIDVYFQDENAWLNKAQMAELFQRDRSVISRHVRNVFDEGELDEKSNVQKMHIAYIHGWDFSHIDGRYTEQDDLPWDYRSVIRKYLRPEMKIMDIDTGGGEFLLSLNHPHENTAAMENFP